MTTAVCVSRKLLSVISISAFGPKLLVVPRTPATTDPAFLSKVRPRALLELARN